MTAFASRISPGRWRRFLPARAKPFESAERLACSPGRPRGVSLAPDDYQPHHDDRSETPSRLAAIDTVRALMILMALKHCRASSGFQASTDHPAAGFSRVVQRWLTHFLATFSCGWVRALSGAPKRGPSAHRFCSPRFWLVVRNSRDRHPQFNLDTTRRAAVLWALGV